MDTILRTSILYVVYQNNKEVIPLKYISSPGGNINPMHGYLRQKGRGVYHLVMLT
jgi:hypothetical protein